MSDLLWTLVVGLAAATAGLASWIASRRRIRRLEEALIRGFQTWVPEDKEDPPPRGTTALEIPADLVEACAGNDCVLFVGAGLGVAAGYPTRTELLVRVLRILEHESPGNGWRELRELLDDKKLNMVEELLASRLPRERLLAIVRQALSQKASRDLPKVLTVLQRLPFCGVISSTWDDLVDRAFRQEEPHRLNSRLSADYAQILRSRDVFLLKPYGDLEDEANLIFTEDEYRRAVYENREYARFVGSLFGANTLLFMGVSLDTIEVFFTNSEIRKRSERTHYALTPFSTATALQQERLKAKFNLELLTFTPTEGYPEVLRFAERLEREVTALIRSDRAPVKPEKLAKVTLQNIGPFERLQLDLNSGWNVLLGDNGCGKSTILRAVALALCGDDRTERAAAKLLREGSQSGFVEIRIGDQDTYRTDLVRDGHRARVNPSAVTPVQSGRWLVLGFPPLRGVSSRAIAGPSNGSGPQTDPAVEDLLPLLDDGVDTRLDDLKQWLVNTAVVADTRRSQAERSKRLLKSFFDIVLKLTPGAEIRYAGYREDPWDVLVETEDGVVSVDLISQGMSSVFAWVGTLLKRLYEIYPKSERPENEECLVLIDEIDAHLHPEWQSEIISILREKFPNLQVIATSHSPLVVADTKEGEIVHLKRIDHHLSVTPVRQSFAGWRADQILTSPPFGMSYARGRSAKRRLETYRELVTRPELSAEEEKKLEEITRELDGLPSRSELQTTRKAAAMMTEWMKDQLDEASEEEQRKLLQEAEIYFAKIRSKN